MDNDILIDIVSRLDKLTSQIRDVISNIFPNSAFILGIGGQNLTIAAGATNYMVPFISGVQVTAFNAVAPVGGVIKYSIFRISSAQPGTGTLVANFEVNNVPTALTITIPAGGVSQNYTSNTEVTIQAGDLIRWGVKNNAAGASAGISTLTSKLAIKNIQ